MKLMNKILWELPLKSAQVAAISELSSACWCDINFEDDENHIWQLLYWQLLRTIQFEITHHSGAQYVSPVNSTRL